MGDSGSTRSGTKVGGLFGRATRWPAIVGAALALWIPGGVAHAKVVEVIVDAREEVLDGRPWGPAGAYEKLSGRIFFHLDPDNPANAGIVDLGLAPRNDAGLVEAWADFMVLQPKDPALRRGVAWVEVSNRGGKASLRYFNAASAGAHDPTTEEHLGDGLLMRQGLTIVWVGWQWDIPPEDELALRLRVPTARGAQGEQISGLVRSDWALDEPAQELGLSHRGHRTYAVADRFAAANVLTVRDGREAPRRTIPRDRWRFVAEDEGPERGLLTRIRLEGGFQAGKIYELVYQARNPRVVGIGLAAIRDVLAYAKHDEESLFPVERGVAFGVSQTGRFLRHFLYQGFNTDEEGRKVYDGMLIHTAGAGRGSFNHRFGQPSRDAHRYSAFFYPTDLFPFTGRTQTDPVTGRTDGLLAHTPRDHWPNVFYTNTGYEYWGRAASLIHTTPDGADDVEPLPNERIYHLASGQHFVGRWPPSPEARMDGGASYRGNPLDFLVTLRALAVRLVEWVDEGSEPPPSAHPRVADGTLVPPGRIGFPAIPGVDTPEVIHVAYRADYGPRWWSQGIVDLQPPELGQAFPSLASTVDSLGNEVAGLQALEIRVPLAAYAPWNLREGAPANEDELSDFRGTFIPLPATEADRGESGDPRPSVAELYPSREAYLARAREAAGDLVSEGVLLEEDVDRVMSRARATWDWVTARSR